jgi:hypothetical protein
MATVTETYILEQDEGETTYPAAARERLQAAIDSGAIVSNTKTPIVDPSEVVAGKARFNVVRVFRSEEDRQNFINDSNADSTLQTYIISSSTRRINQTIS